MKSIRRQFKLKLDIKDFNDAGLLEILGASFVANEPAIFGTPDEDYIAKELKWYNSKSLNILDMIDPPKIWYKCASDEGYINSNYGWCIFSEDNGSQYEHVVTKLKTNSSTKRACMIYTRPTMHTDAIKDGINDFICTNAVTYKITNGSIDAIVQMRSNDAVYGYKNDYAWQNHVLGRLAKDLNVAKGKIYWQTASLHIYPRHFGLI